MMLNVYFQWLENSSGETDRHVHRLHVHPWDYEESQWRLFLSLTGFVLLLLLRSITVHQTSLHLDQTVLLNVFMSAQKHVLALLLVSNLCRFSFAKCVQALFCHWTAPHKRANFASFTTSNGRTLYRETSAGNSERIFHNYTWGREIINEHVCIHGDFLYCSVCFISRLLKRFSPSVPSRTQCLSWCPWPLMWPSGTPSSPHDCLEKRSKFHQHPAGNIVNYHTLHPSDVSFVVVINSLYCSVTEDEAKDVHRSLKIAAGTFKTLKVRPLLNPFLLWEIHMFYQSREPQDVHYRDFLSQWQFHLITKSIVLNTKISDFQCSLTSLATHTLSHIKV